MIVKTGANYQNEGGYIEFSTGVSTAIVNGDPVPSIVYSDSLQVIGLQTFNITRSAGISGTLRYVTYSEYTGITGEKFRHYQSVILAEGETNTITLPTCFASPISAPDGYHPKLGDESKNVKLIQTSGGYFIQTTGDEPLAVIELEANE